MCPNLNQSSFSRYYSSVRRVFHNIRIYTGEPLQIHNSRPLIVGDVFLPHLCEMFRGAESQEFFIERHKVLPKRLLSLSCYR